MLFIVLVYLADKTRMVLYHQVITIEVYKAANLQNAMKWGDSLSSLVDGLLETNQLR